MFRSLDRQHLAASEAHAASSGLAWGTRTNERERPAWPVGSHSYTFDLDDDLAKLVTIQTVPGGIEVDVQYGGDVLLQQDRYTMHLDRPPRIRLTGLGVVLEVTRPILPGLAWPCWRLTYRF